MPLFTLATLASFIAVVVLGRDRMPPGPII